VTWRVGWTEAAQQQLAQVWLDATDRDAVNRAVAVLDRHLNLDPAELGESRASNRRIAFQQPLAIIFVVEKRLLLVTVIRVSAPKR
jgi:hypothetical protein